MGFPDSSALSTRYRASVLNPVGYLRHVAVGGSLLVGPVLVLAGVMGGGTHEERFDAKQVVVSPLGTDGVRIRETVDEDFGTYDRHGYERIIPNDFGAATDVTAYSATAPDLVTVKDQGYETRIRIGDPDTTIDGQHRYELSYTLPDAQLSTGQLAAAGASLGLEAFRQGAFWWSVASIPLIGALNLGVSFYFAFRLALQAHNVSKLDRARIRAAIWARWRSHPLSFFVPA